MRIRGHSKAGNFGVDFRASRLRGFERLENEHRATFSENHSAAILAEWPASIRRHDAHRFPRFQQSQAEGRFASAGECEVGVTAAHHLECEADGMIRRRACCGERKRRARRAELHADLARSGVDHRARDD